MPAKEFLSAVRHYPLLMLPGILLTGMGLHVIADGGAAIATEIGWSEVSTDTWFRVGNVVIENADAYDPQALQERYPGGKFETHVRVDPMQLKGHTRLLTIVALMSSGGLFLKKGVARERTRTA